MPSPPLPATADRAGLGVVHCAPRKELLAFATLPGLGGGLPSVFLIKRGKRWKEVGKTNFSFLFGSNGKAEGQGTVGESGASLCLNYYAKNKTNKKQLALSLWKEGPSPRLLAAGGAEREAEAKVISLAASEGAH